MLLWCVTDVVEVDTPRKSLHLLLLVASTCDSVYHPPSSHSILHPPSSILHPPSSILHHPSFISPPLFPPSGRTGRVGPQGCPQSSPWCLPSQRWWRPCRCSPWRRWGQVMACMRLGALALRLTQWGGRQAPPCQRRGGLGPSEEVGLAETTST